jgi:hypothetical protein
VYFLGVSTSVPHSAMMHNIMDSDNETLKEDIEESDPFLGIPPPLSQEPHPNPTPSTTSDPLSRPSQPSTSSKKCKVSTQDIQQMQLEVLALEKKKIELEVENLSLANEKLRLEIQNLLKNQPVFDLEVQ